MKFLRATLIVTCYALAAADAASVGGRPPAGVPQGSLVVGPESAFCQDANAFLTCDFKWDQENIYLPSHGIAKDYDLVILQRVHNLVLDRRACLNLSLREVAQARAEGAVDSSCSKVELSLRNVSLDAVEAPVTSLYAYKSRLERIAMEDVDSKLTVISSSVGAFDVARVVGSGVTVQLHSTTVKRLENLHVAGNSKVLLHDVTFEGALEHSLVLASKGNLMTAVKFPPLKTEGVQPAALLLKHGADVTLENLRGSIKIAAPPCPALQERATEEALTTTPSEPEDQERNVLLLPLAASLALNGVFPISFCIWRCLASKVESETKETQHNARPLLSSPNETPSPRVKKKRKNNLLSNLRSYVRLTKTHLQSKKSRQKISKHSEKSELRRSSINHSAVLLQRLTEREERPTHRKARRRTLTHHGPYPEYVTLFTSSSEDGESYAIISSTDSNLSNGVSHV